jgi:hypothetical protein
MRIATHYILLLLLLPAVYVSATTPTVTLYPPIHLSKNRLDWSKSLFSFKSGLLQEMIKNTTDWDLSYGTWIIADQDWFGLHFGPQTRSVIKDLGEHNWDEPLSIPILEPRPLVQKGQQWHPTVVVANDPGGAWTRSGEYAKVILGHMYLLHVKDETADFYVMFRVEDFEQHKHCTISWRTIPTPKPEQQNQAGYQDYP